MEEMNMTQLVKVYNDYTSPVFYNYNNMVRIWDYTGAVKQIPLNEIYEVANTKGGKVLFEEGMLLVKESKVREFIGLKPLDKYNPDLQRITEILKAEKNEELEEVLQYCNDTTLEKIVTSAIDLPIKSMSQADLIRDYSGTNILLAIEERQSENEEPSAIQPSDGDQPVRKRKKIVQS